MKPLNVEDLLRQAQVPDPGAQYWAQFPEELHRRLATAPASLPPRARERQRLPAAWALAAAAACGLIAGFILGHQPSTPSLTDTSPSDFSTGLKDGQALSHYLPFYHGRLQAIEEDGTHLRLVLSKEKNVPASLPVWVELDDGQERRTLDIFSGQNFRIGSEQVEVLANPDGEVMLIGRDFIWSNRDAAPRGGGVHVQAQLVPQKF